MFQPIIYIWYVCLIMFVYQRLLLMLSREMRRQITTFLDLIVHPSGVPGPLWTPTPPRIPEEGSRCFFLHLRAISKIAKTQVLFPSFTCCLASVVMKHNMKTFPFSSSSAPKTLPHRVACWCMLDTFLQRYKRSSPYPSLSVAAFKVGPKNQLQMGWFFFALWQLRVFSNTPRQTHPIDFPVFFSGGPLAFTPIEKSTVVGRHTLGPLGATSRRLFQMRPMRLAGLFTYNGNYTFKPNVSVNNTIPMEHHLGMFYRRIKTSPEIGVSLILIVALTSYTCMTCHTLKLRVANLKLDLSFCRTIYHSFSGEVVRIDRCIHNFSYSFHLMQHQPPWARFWVLAYLGPFLRDLQHDLI